MEHAANAESKAVGMAASVFVTVVEVVHGGGDGAISEVGGVEGGVENGYCEEAGEGEDETDDGSFHKGKLVRLGNGRPE